MRETSLKSRNSAMRMLSVSQRNITEMFIAHRYCSLLPVGLCDLDSLVNNCHNCARSPQFVSSTPLQLGVAGLENLSFKIKMANCPEMNLNLFTDSHLLLAFCACCLFKGIQTSSSLHRRIFL